jgi:hypothetical protein
MVLSYIELTHWSVTGIANHLLSNLEVLLKRQMLVKLGQRILEALIGFKVRMSFGKLMLIIKAR